MITDSVFILVIDVCLVLLTRQNSSANGALLMTNAVTRMILAFTIQKCYWKGRYVYSCYIFNTVVLSGMGEFYDIPPKDLKKMK